MGNGIRLVHTSDFHLGVSFVGIRGFRIQERRLEDFKRNIISIVDEAIRWGADIFIVAGDIFHRVNPSPRELVFIAEQFGRLIERRIHIIAIAGNHDKPKIPNTHNPLVALDKAKAPFFKFVESLPDKPIVLEASSKRIGIVALPYINPYIVVRELERSYTGYIKEKVKLLVEKLDSYDVDYKILVAHTYIAGSRVGGYYIKPSIDEKIGIDALCPLEFDYIALGHIHTLQKVRDNTYYSGSIERIDFSEEGEDKGFLTVKLIDGHVEVMEHRLQCRRMVTKRISMHSLVSLSQLREILKNEVRGALLRLIIDAPPEVLEALTRRYRELENILLNKLGVFGYTIKRLGMDMVYSEESKQIAELRMSLDKLLREYIRKKIRDEALADKLYNLAVDVFRKVLGE